MGSDSMNGVEGMGPGIEAVLDAPGVRGEKVTGIGADSTAGVAALMRSIVSREEEEEEEGPFYVLDLGVVVGLYKKWIRHLPTVHPFYAVKCNPHPALLGAMAALGSGFDCASPAEIDAALAAGATPARILYANPCKPPSHVRHAVSAGVSTTTFDAFSEVDKLRRWHPSASLLLRLHVPGDADAQCPLNAKYGALPHEVAPLLSAARAAGLRVAGVSFHVGSGARRPSAFGAAIAVARSAFDAAERLKLPPMTVLNIGGGFTAGAMFEEAAVVINAALAAYFGGRPGLEVVSEPGRFFAEAAFTLATRVIGKRVRGEAREYWINDGIYGSMNCLLYDHATVTAAPLAEAEEGREETHVSTVFGPTCDALDTVLTGHALPELHVGDDWLVFPNMGAYTAAAGSNFNGFATSAIPTYLAYSTR